MNKRKQNMVVHSNKKQLKGLIYGWLKKKRYKVELSVVLIMYNWRYFNIKINGWILSTDPEAVRRVQV